MKEKQFSINGKQFNVSEIFCAVPKLKDVYDKQIDYIENYDNYEWEENVTKEKIINKLIAYLEIFTDLDLIDLATLFYIRNSRGITRQNLQTAVRKVYESEISLLNEINPKENAYNPLACVAVPKGM